MRFLIRVLVTAVALWIATLLVNGITVSGNGTGTNALTLIVVALIFGIINGFWAAFWGAIVVTVVGWAINLIIPDRRPQQPQR